MARFANIFIEANFVLKMFYFKLHNLKRFFQGIKKVGFELINKTFVTLIVQKTDHVDLLVLSQKDQSCVLA